MILITRVALLLSLLTPASASAWSNKEHIQLTRIAALRLIAHPDTPDAMKQWLKDANPRLSDMAAEREFFLTARVGIFPRGADGLAFWATAPDLEALTGGSGDWAKKVKPFGVPERVLHFIDLEFFMPEESRRVYAHDLSNKPKLTDVPRDMKDWRFERAGMLPFRVEQCYGELVKAIRDGRLIDKPGQFPRDEHAAKWAGFLAHYVQDNTQPQHATVDYKSQHYFPKPARAPNVHADMEYRLVDDEASDYPEIRETLWTALLKQLDEVKDPSTSQDVWTQTVEISLHSYDALPLIGQAAQAAYGPNGRQPFDAAAFANHKGEVAGQEMTLVEMKARQLALAVARVEKLWLRAWMEATAEEPPALPLQEKVE